MLPLHRLGGAHLSRIAAYMGLALHELPGGYALLKLSDASSCYFFNFNIFVINVLVNQRFSCKYTYLYQACSSQIQLLLKWLTLVEVNTSVNIKL